MTERERAITNLMAVDLRGGSHEMLSSIAKAIHKPTCGGWTIGACQVLRDTLVNLLSETDEEALREAYTKGREDGMGVANKADMRAEYLRGRNDGYDEGYDAGFASADDWLGQHEDAMAEHGWYRALDADKNPIRISDAVEHNGVRANVLGITFHGTTPPTVCIMRGDCWVEADELHHVKQPTVEDVLREMADRCYADEDEPRDRDAIVAEYAAKLQLRGDAE